ncbi:DNL zinc finger-domain-containing protein [Neohortaea acidophila]|uniref:DNL zinc finger-domain-containing protein n=1 Tax=Neohortaea acidophila TaxID=245834 RepID=A0A6A6Q6T3_9PEZI|nr:DNL zinc finger-domain-containing protein [Neohortaea acidophila]KAF2487343.1 DNL zinc finger-domain-containing protein [Neohortaea acidophila]
MATTAAVRQLPRLSRSVLGQCSVHFPRAQRSFHVQRTPSWLPRTSILTRPIRAQIRRESTEPQRSLTDRDTDSASSDASKEASEIAARKAEEPAYELTFTCRKCLHRSSHRVTKQAYHFGTTLITCPGCKNRHLISDHLKIFSDKGITIEDILREKGQYLRKGRLGDDGDVEFYDEENNEIGQKLAEEKKQSES